jgi:ketosteroid isomerase-like protein
MTQQTLKADQAIIQQLMDYQSAADWEGVRGLLTDDAVFEMPFINEKHAGKEVIIARWSPAVARMEGSKFYGLSLRPLAEPGCYVANFQNTCKMRTTGRIYDQAYIAIIHVRNGRVSHFVEYFDTLRLAIATNRVQAIE